MRGALDDERRTALMRTHSGLHVLCGVVFRDYGALVTGGNMEPLSARMDFDLTEVPDGFRDTVAQALDHRHIPIERLLGMIKGERNSANSPPISVNFIFQKTFIHNANFGDFDLIDMPSLPAGAIYDLNFFMVERPDASAEHSAMIAEARAMALLK